MNKSIKKRIIAFGAIGVAAVGMAYTNSNYFEMAKNIEIYANVYKELNTHYVDDIDPAKLMRIGIDAMTNSLDPFTNYISEADIEGYRIQSSGKYGGVGFRTDAKVAGHEVSQPHTSTQLGVVPDSVAGQMINRVFADRPGAEQVH